jgi:hypothetical protein
MRLHDRSADGEADAHAAFLRGKEALEQTMKLVLGYSGTIVLNQGADCAGVCQRGPDEEAAFSLACHRLQRVDREICEHLLERDPVTPHNGEIQSQIERRLHELAPKLRPRNSMTSSTTSLGARSDAAVR